MMSASMAYFRQRGLCEMKIMTSNEEYNKLISPLKAYKQFSEFKTDAAGLVPVVVQDEENGQVLMVAYMNEQAYYQTVQEGVMTYWSRSRSELWRKGDTSGHYQIVCSLEIDCDSDTILAKVKQVGAACHTGHRSCFFTALAKNPKYGKN